MKIKKNAFSEFVIANIEFVKKEQYFGSSYHRLLSCHFVPLVKNDEILSFKPMRGVGSLACDTSNQLQHEEGNWSSDRLMGGKPKHGFVCSWKK